MSTKHTNFYQCPELQSCFWCQHSGTVSHPSLLPCFALFYFPPKLQSQGCFCSSRGKQHFQRAVLGRRSNVLEEEEVAPRILPSPERHRSVASLHMVISQRLTVGSLHWWGSSVSQVSPGSNVGTQLYFCQISQNTGWWHLSQRYAFMLALHWLWEDIIWPGRKCEL